MQHISWKRVYTSRILDSVSNNRFSNLFERFSALRPTVTPGHNPQYIKAVLEAAAGAGIDAEIERETEDVRTFVRHFMDAPSAFSTTPAGIAALKFEAWMMKNRSGVFKQLVEVIVGEKDPEFVAVFQGRIPESEWNTLKYGVREFAELELVTEAGDRSSDEYERADVTIMTGKPVKGMDTSDVTGPVVTSKKEKDAAGFAVNWQEPRESVDSTDLLFKLHEGGWQTLTDLNISGARDEIRPLLEAGLAVVDRGGYLITHKGRQAIADVINEATGDLDEQQRTIFHAMFPRLRKEYPQKLTEEGGKGFDYAGHAAIPNGMRFCWEDVNGESLYVNITTINDTCLMESWWEGSLIRRQTGALNEVTSASVSLPREIITQVAEDSAYVMDGEAMVSRWGNWRVAPDPLMDGTMLLAFGGESPKPWKGNIQQIQDRMDEMLHHAGSWKVFDSRVEEMLRGLVGGSVNETGVTYSHTARAVARDAKIEGAHKFPDSEHQAAFHHGFDRGFAGKTLDHGIEGVSDEANTAYMRGHMTGTIHAGRVAKAESRNESVNEMEVGKIIQHAGDNWKVGDRVIGDESDLEKRWVTDGQQVHFVHQVAREGGSTKLMVSRVMGPLSQSVRQGMSAWRRAGAPEADWVNPKVKPLHYVTRVAYGTH